MLLDQRKPENSIPQQTLNYRSAISYPVELPMLSRDTRRHSSRRGICNSAREYGGMEYGGVPVSVFWCPTPHARPAPFARPWLSPPGYIDVWRLQHRRGRRDLDV